MITPAEINWEQFVLNTPLIMTAAIVFVILCAIIFVAFQTKTKVLQDLLAQSFTFEDINLSKTVGINLKIFEKFTKELEELGFAKLKDYTIKPALAEGGARLMVNEREKIFAEINQFGSLEAGVSFITLFQDNYRLDSDSRKQIVNLDLHSSRYLKENYPGKTPAEILQIHRERVNNFETERNLYSLDSTEDNYFDALRYSIEYQKKKAAGSAIADFDTEAEMTIHELQLDTEEKEKKNS